MIKKTNIKTQVNNKITVGKVLISSLAWKHDIYERAVILITGHDEDESTGLILNKPFDICSHEAFDEDEERLNYHSPIYCGGETNDTTIFWLHDKPDQIRDSIHIKNNLFLGGLFSDLKALVDNKQFVSGIKFIAGNVLWKENQLEQELNDGKWILAEISNEEIFGHNCKFEDLWLSKLFDVNKRSFALIAQELENPGLN